MTRHRRLRRAAALLVAVALAGSGGPAAQAAAVPADTVRVTVDQGTASGHYDQRTRGLSVDVRMLARPGLFASPMFARYLRTMSPGGVLRMGGSGADSSFWTSTGETPPSWAAATVTPSDVDALASLVRRTGWQVVFTVDLAHYDPARAADEVAYVARALHGSLRAVEIGNEPNFYYPDTEKYWTDFEAYAGAIRQRTPHVRFIGPGDAEAPGYDPEAFRAAFVAHESAHPDIAGLNRHHYRWGGCDVTIPKLLAQDTHDDAVAVADRISAQAATLGVPAYIGELNSSAVGGCAGVSDTLAAALWTTDYVLASAQHGVSGLYFHTLPGRCGAPRPDYGPYTSLCAPTDADAAAGRERAQAPYYGLLGLRFVDSGAFLGARSSAASLRAYAVRGAHGVSVVLVDVADPASSAPAQVSVDLGAAYRHARSATLTTSSPDGLAATSGLTFGGATMSEDGSLRGMRWTPTAVDGEQLQLTVPPGSVTVVRLH